MGSRRDGGKRTKGEGGSEIYDIPVLCAPPRAQPKQTSTRDRGASHHIGHAGTGCVRRGPAQRSQRIRNGSRPVVNTAPNGIYIHRRLVGVSAGDRGMGGPDT